MFTRTWRNPKECAELLKQEGGKEKREHRIPRQILSDPERQASRVYTHVRRSTRYGEEIRVSRMKEEDASRETKKKRKRREGKGG